MDQPPSIISNKHRALKTYLELNSRKNNPNKLPAGHWIRRDQVYGRVLGTILAESQGVHPSDRWRDPNANLQTYPLLISVFRQGPELYINAMRDMLGDFSQTNFRNSYIIQKQRQIWLKLDTFNFGCKPEWWVIPSRVCVSQEFLTARQKIHNKYN